MPDGSPHPLKPRPLPPIAAKVDAALIGIDRKVDWLMALSPVGNDQMWRDFTDSGYRSSPTLRYAEPRADLAALREDLLALPVRDVEEPPLQALLREKQRELDRQIELVSLRGTDGFIPASIDLFGEADPDLIRTARTILDTVEREPGTRLEAGTDDLVAAASAEMDAYRAADPSFGAEIFREADVNGFLMVNHGNLYVSEQTRLSGAQIAPMIAHEVGTHVLTAHNGRCQSLRQLAFGLAGYDPLQEGLGTFAEYLTGYLPPKRLRVLAARVIAADMAVAREPLTVIFDALHDGEGMLADDAFDIAVRAKRGGGLTKDAVYLRGLRELLAYLSAGGDFEFLLLGKFAMAHRHTIRRLLDEGWVVGPTILPSYLSDEKTQQRLEAARTVTVDELFQTVPG